MQSSRPKSINNQIAHYKPTIKLSRQSNLYEDDPIIFIMEERRHLLLELVASLLILPCIGYADFALIGGLVLQMDLISLHLPVVGNKDGGKLIESQ